MKKILSVTLIFMILFGIFSISAFAEEVQPADRATVYVTISDGEGRLVMTQEAVTVTDIDKDGLITVNDALYCAHELQFNGGAAAGYGFANGEYGLYITKLWGIENGESYGYFINNNFASSLAEPVKEGDCVNAFVYTDLVGWSDTYCWFDTNTLTVTEGTDVTLTLSCAGYDSDWNPVVLPVEGATITIDGVATDCKTNSDGKVTVTIKDAGNFVISAISETQTLVPPVCKAYVTEKEVGTAPDDNTAEMPTNAPEEDDTPKVDTEKKGCTSTVGMGSTALIGAITAIAFVLKRKKNEV